jgi:hypothetical protein
MQKNVCNRLETTRVIDTGGKIVLLLAVSRLFLIRLQVDLDLQYD